MWLFPGLTILAAVGILAVLVQMGLKSDTRSQLLLSLLSWGIVLVLYADHPLAWRLDRRGGARRP